jgi:hypothetical protein
MCRPGSVIEDCGMQPLIPSNREFSNLLKLYPNESGECRSLITSASKKDGGDKGDDSERDGDDDKDDEEEDEKNECEPIIVYSSICSNHASSLLPECKSRILFCSKFNEPTLCPVIGPPMPVYKPFLHFAY